MGSVEEAPLSLNGGSIAGNLVPHYLHPSAGSCHDICKYGKRRSSDDLSDAKKPNKPCPNAKSFSSRPNKVGVVQVQETNSSVAKKAVKHSLRPKPVSSDGVHGKRRRNDDALNGRNMGAPMLSTKKAMVNVGRKNAGVKRVKTDSPSSLESSSSPMFLEQEVDNQEIKCIDNEVETENAMMEENEIKKPIIEAERNEFELEYVTDAPTSSSFEEIDEVISDTALCQRKRDHYKRRRRSKVGDKHCRPVRIKFRNGIKMHLQKEENPPSRLKLRRTRSKEDVSSSVSDSNKSTRIGSLKASRSRDKRRSKASKNRCGRIRYGKTRVLVLGNRVGYLKRKYEMENGVNAMMLSRRNNLKRQEQLQMTKDVQFLFSYVVEETMSKLAERRKGMVKSLVGVFESLITLQARSRFLRVTT